MFCFDYGFSASPDLGRSDCISTLLTEVNGQMFYIHLFESGNSGEIYAYHA